MQPIGLRNALELYAIFRPYLVDGTPAQIVDSVFSQIKPDEFSRCVFLMTGEEIKEGETGIPEFVLGMQVNEIVRMKSIMEQTGIYG